MHAHGGFTSRPGLRVYLPRMGSIIGSTLTIGRDHDGMFDRGARAKCGSVRVG